VSARPVVLAAAVGGPLLERGAAEARRRFPDAPLVALVHWRAAGAVPPGMQPYLASEYRDRPAALVRELRGLRPRATVVVCDGAPGASGLKALALFCGGERIVVREAGDAYRLPHDAGALARHLAARLVTGVERVLCLAGAVAGLPVLLAGVWRWRRRRSRP